MYIYFECLECITEAHDRKQDKVLSYVSANTINEDGYFEFVCPSGHQNKIILRATKFEILFMIGENALLDGYYREAISSFYTALERAYEEYVRFVCFLEEVPQKTFEDTWKRLVKQSERQLGAATLVWLLKNKETPTALSEKNVNLRNNVIHKGYLPSFDEALNFGKNVITVIDPIYREVVKHTKFYKYLDERIHLKKYDKKSLRTTNVMTGICKKVKFNEEFEKHLSAISAGKQYYKFYQDIGKYFTSRKEGFFVKGNLK